MFTHPEISLWRKGQETFGGNVHIGELHKVLATGVIAKPAGRVLLTNVTIHHHNGINPADLKIHESREVFLELYDLTD